MVYGRSTIRFPTDARSFVLLQTVRLWDHLVSYSKSSGVLSLDIKRPGRGNDHSQLSALSRLRIIGAIHLLPSTSSWLRLGQLYPILHRYGYKGNRKKLLKLCFANKPCHSKFEHLTVHFMQLTKINYYPKQVPSFVYKFHIGILLKDRVISAFRRGVSEIFSLL